VNSYLIRGEEPTVIDTGITPEVPEFDVALRGLIAVRPPTFDNPGTLAFFDPKQNTLFSADCFGAPFTTAEAALVEDVAAVHEEELTPAQLLWGSVDSPWAHFVEEARLADNLNRFLRDKPDTVLSTTSRRFTATSIATSRPWRSCRRRRHMSPPTGLRSRPSWRRWRRSRCRARSGSA
jgi:hypothetical protein